MLFYGGLVSFVVGVLAVVELVARHLVNPLPRRLAVTAVPSRQLSRPTRDGGGGAVVELQDRPVIGMGPRRRLPGSRGLGRLAAVAALAAGLMTGLELTRQLLPDARSDDLGPLFVIVLAVVWLVAAALVSALVLPAWLGSRRIRRVLGACCLVGFGGALHWLSYEPGDVAGYAVGITVALLLATATAAALLAERAP